MRLISAALKLLHFGLIARVDLIPGLVDWLYLALIPHKSPFHFAELDRGDLIGII